jgi:hypothetical protein
MRGLFERKVRRGNLGGKVREYFTKALLGLTIEYVGPSLLCLSGALYWLRYCVRQDSMARSAQRPA